MRQFLRVGMLIGCLLIGSLYPKLLLDHHVKLVNQAGIEQRIERERTYQKEIPLKIEFRFLEIFR